MESEELQPLWTAPRDGTTIYLHGAGRKHRGWWRKPDKHVPDGCWMLKSYGRCDYEITGWSQE